MSGGGGRSRRRRQELGAKPFPRCAAALHTSLCRCWGVAGAPRRGVGLFSAIAKEELCSPPRAPGCSTHPRSSALTLAGATTVTALATQDIVGSARERSVRLGGGEEATERRERADKPAIGQAAASLQPRRRRARLARRGPTPSCLGGHSNPSWQASVAPHSKPARVTAAAAARAHNRPRRCRRRWLHSPSLPSSALSGASKSTAAGSPSLSLVGGESRQPARTNLPKS